MKKEININQERLEKKIKFWLTIGTVGYLITAVPWFLFAWIIWKLTFLNPSDTSPSIIKNIMSLMHLAYPLIALGCVVIAWIHFFRNRSVKSLKLLIIPIAYAALVTIFFLMGV